MPWGVRAFAGTLFVFCVLLLAAGLCQSADDDRWEYWSLRILFAFGWLVIGWGMLLLLLVAVGWAA